MSTTDKHTDLTAQEQPQYDDVHLSLWPGGALRATGVGAVVISSAVPAAALFYGTTTRGMGIGTATVVTIGLYLFTLLLVMFLVPLAAVRLVPHVAQQAMKTASKPGTTRTTHNADRHDIEIFNGTGNAVGIEQDADPDNVGTGDR